MNTRRIVFSLSITALALLTACGPIRRHERREDRREDRREEFRGASASVAPVVPGQFVRL